MPLKTNLTKLTPRREVYRKEIKLLSGGFSAPESFPGGRITVYPWDSTADDLMLESARNGENHVAGLVKVLKHLCNLNGCSPDNFVGSEVNTVFLVARAIQSGGVMHYPAVCPACGYETSESVRLPDDLEKLGEKGPGYPGYDDITLPNCKDAVRIRPLLIKDEMLILNRTPIQRQDGYSESLLRTLVPIVNVGGGQPDTIEELKRWYDALPPEDEGYLKTMQSRLTPHLNSTLEHRCDKCRFDFKHTLSFDREFFRPSLSPEQGGEIQDDVRSGVAREGDGGEPRKSP